MKPEDVLTELNLDNTASNLAIITNLIAQASDVVIHAVDSTKTAENYATNPIFQRAVITLVTELYYDRTLSSGTSPGFRMMINQLKGQVVTNAN